MTFRLSQHTIIPAKAGIQEPRNEKRPPRCGPSTHPNLSPSMGKGVTQRGLPSPEIWSERWLCGRLMHR